MFSLKRYPESESYLLQAYNLRQKVLGERHEDCAVSLNALGQLYIVINRFDEAEKLLLAGMEITALEKFLN